MNTPPNMPAEARARILLAHRLMRRHGLTPGEALDALDQARDGRDGPHTDLARAEARAALEEMCGPVRDLLQRWAEAVGPALQALGATMRHLAEQLRGARQDDYALAPPRPERSDRPAWQSPYGPPQERTRR